MWANFQKKKETRKIDKEKVFLEFQLKYQIFK